MSLEFPNKAKDSRLPQPSSQSQFYSMPERLRTQIRRQKIQTANKQRMNTFIQNSLTTISDFMIIEPLKKYQSITDSEMKNALRVLKVEMVNRKLGEKLQMIEFEKTLVEILKVTGEIVYKKIIVDCFRQLCSYNQVSIERLFDQEIEVWVIEQLLRVEAGFESIEYVVSIAKLVQNLTVKNPFAQKKVGYFIEQGYFNLVEYTYSLCIKKSSENQLKSTQSHQQLLDTLSSTATSFLSSKNLPSQLILQITSLIFLNLNHQTHFSKSLPILSLIHSLLLTKNLDYKQLNTQLSLQTLFAQIISNSLDSEMNSKRNEWGEKVEVQMYSDQFKICLMEVLVLGYQTNILDYYFDIPYQFIKKLIWSKQRVIQDLSLKLLNHVLINLDDTSRYQPLLTDKLCKMVIGGLDIKNKNIIPYLSIIEHLSLGLINPSTPSTLLKQNLLNQLSQILIDPTRVDAEVLIVIMRILIIYLKNSKKEKNEEVKRMMNRMKITNIVFSIQDHKNFHVRNLAFSVLDAFESWGKQRE